MITPVPKVNFTMGLAVHHAQQGASVAKMEQRARFAISKTTTSKLDLTACMILVKGDNSSTVVTA